MSDAIFVTGLVLHAYHGVMQHEAKVGQTFTLDLLLSIDLSAASRLIRSRHKSPAARISRITSNQLTPESRAERGRNRRSPSGM